MGVMTDITEEDYAEFVRESRELSDIKRNKVTISQEEYEELLEASALLECLKGCGVDNWDGWDDAQEMLDSWNEE